jgi:hypothetical protein
LTIGSELDQELANIRYNHNSLDAAVAARFAGIEAGYALRFANLEAAVAALQPVVPPPALNFGTLSPLNSIVQISEGGSITTADAGYTRYYLPHHALVHPDAGGYRAEHQYRDDVSNFDGRIRAIKFKIQLGSGWHLGQSAAFEDRIFWQLHQGGGLPPRFSAHIDETDNTIRFRRFNGNTASPKFTNYTRVAIGAPLIEHEIVIVYKLSKGADGYFKAYIDNQLVATHTGSIILPEASVAYTKRGIYGQPTNLFMSEYKMVQGPDAYAAIKEA